MFMKNLFIFLLLSLVSTIAKSQTINGLVTDNNNLPFPNVSVVDKTSGKSVVTDIDGKFSFVESTKLDFLIISYLGFDEQKIDFDTNKQFYNITLNAKPQDIASNKITAQNIINKVVQTKNSNNPQKTLTSFSFKSYNKLLITANSDSLKGTIDSVFITKNNKKYFSKVDSSEYKFKKIIEKQHLFETEKVSDFQYINNKLKETVIGLKMSGFKQPVYEILGFNLQSFLVYDNQYELFKTKYKSPISDDVTSDYSYKLLDTITLNGRKCFAINFKNRKKVNESGLEGLLFIDIQNFAIARAIMRVKNVLDITGIHDFEYNDLHKIWFPKSKTFKVVKGKNSDDIKLFGGTIQFDADELKNEKPRQKHSSDYVYILSETTNTDIKFNDYFVVKKPSIAIEVKDSANSRDSIFWNKYSTENFDLRAQKTYMTLDTLVLKRKLEKKFLFGKKFINGFVPIGTIDLDLRKFFNFNNYEGFRLCLGGVTNEKLSRKFR